MPKSCRKSPRTAFLSSFPPSFLSLPSLTEFQFLVSILSCSPRLSPFSLPTKLGSSWRTWISLLLQNPSPWKPLQPLGFLICKTWVLHPNSQGCCKEQLRELGKSHSQKPACFEHSGNVVIYTILITRSQQHLRPLADPSAPLPLLPLRLGPLDPKLMHFFPPPMIGY